MQANRSVQAAQGTAPPPFATALLRRAFLAGAHLRRVEALPSEDRPMRSVNDWFGSYSADHQNPVNRLIHWICVPAILWAVIAFLWLIPVPASIGRPGLWCGLVMVGALAFYWRLSRPLGAAMFAAFVLLALLTEFLFRRLGSNDLFWVAVAVFAVAWVGQFIGHLIEGRRPSFFTDLQYLLIGPAWLMGKLMRRVGLAY